MRAAQHIHDAMALRLSWSDRRAEPLPWWSYLVISLPDGPKCDELEAYLRDCLDWEDDGAAMRIGISLYNLAFGELPPDLPDSVAELGPVERIAWYLITYGASRDAPALPEPYEDLMASVDRGIEALLCGRPHQWVGKPWAEHMACVLSDREWHLELAFFRYRQGLGVPADGRWSTQGPRNFEDFCAQLVVRCYPHDVEGAAPFAEMSWEELRREQARRLQLIRPNTTEHIMSLFLIGSELGKQAGVRLVRIEVEYPEVLQGVTSPFEPQLVEPEMFIGTEEDWG